MLRQAVTVSRARDLFDVAGRVVIVTGGLGQLGRQFTRTLLERGAKVAVFDLHPISADLASAWQELSEGHLLALEVDVTDRASIERGVARVTQEWAAPYALINNAALDSPPNASAEANGPFESYPGALWDRVMEVNVKGVMLCCQVVGSHMAAAGRGTIININSIYGLVSPDQRLYEYRREQGALFFKPAAYAVSKSALLNLTRYLATYWAPQNVRVNTLTFGGVHNQQDERFLQEYVRRVPLGRMAREDEYNGAIVFLVSEASAYMTGANLTIDGGWTAW